MWGVGCGEGGGPAARSAPSHRLWPAELCCALLRTPLGLSLESCAGLSTQVWCPGAAAPPLFCPEKVPA